MRDREAGRDGQAEVGHLGEVRALAAEQVLQVLVALGEVVDVLRHAPSLPHPGATRTGASGPAGSEGARRRPQSSVTPAHRLMPASTASWSIAASSSSVSGGPVERVEVGVELLHRGGADDRGGDPRVAQRPLQRQLGELLAARRGDLVEPADVPQGGLVEVALADRAVVAGRARVRGDAVEVAVGEQPLGERA